MNFWSSPSSSSPNPSSLGGIGSSPVNMIDSITDDDGEALIDEAEQRVEEMTDRVAFHHQLNGEGVCVSYLAGAKHGRWPGISWLKDAVTGPRFSGTADDLLESLQSPASKQKAECMLRNVVKICNACGKACAITLDICNSCSGDIKDTPKSYTDNVMMCFMLGIEGTPRCPLTIPIRSQSPSYLCYDDLLASSPCHLNVIPTEHYLPDWRWLLTRPRDGLEIMESLYQVAKDVATSQFLSNREFLQKLFSPSLVNEILRDPGHFVDNYVMSGFDYPPSQMQLHLQFIVLNSLVESSATIDLIGQTDAESVVEYIKECTGIDYYTHHRQMMGRFKLNNRVSANWQADDFEFIVVSPPENSSDKDMVISLRSGESIPKKSSVALQSDDKLVLQNYGRPYSIMGAPTGDVCVGYEQRVAGLEQENRYLKKRLMQQQHQEIPGGITDDGTLSDLAVPQPEGVVNVNFKGVNVVVDADDDDADDDNDASVHFLVSSLPLSYVAYILMTNQSPIVDINSPGASFITDRAGPEDLHLLPEEQVMHRFHQVRCYIQETCLGTGVVLMTSQRFVWLSLDNESVGVGIEYKSIQLHATATELCDDIPEPCLYLQLEPDVSEDDDEMEDPPEIRLVPSNPGETLQQMFDALNEMQLMHPDDGDEDGSTADDEAPMDLSGFTFAPGFTLGADTPNGHH
ncbi:Methylosome subunit pICln [Perkinsus chesapeaki]|uniref:Methylosome subunit pICln n=1 Tax=Perkinsus chesapeaki TaxID=330153 RepID=A0A7J6L2Y5_PERCH|nr:Methylosome subunit pICln [Perkinsus chesapeaki]